MNNISTKLTTNIKNKKNAWICILLFFLFIISRLLFLDEDLPPWGIINYQPIDEGSYAILALNQYNYGAISPDVFDGDVEYIVSPHVRTNIIGNVITYIGLRLFGDTYWGLRMGSVLCGFFIFALSLLIFKELDKLYSSKPRYLQYIKYGFMIYQILDFSFLMACRVMETSIFRAVFVSACIYFFIKLKDRPFLNYFVLGILITISVFGVYITNVFLYLSIALTIIFYGIQNGKRHFGLASSGIISGSLIALVPLELYYYLVWNTSVIKNMFEAIFDFSSQDGYEITFSFWVLLRSTVHFIASNVNLYNIGFFSILLICLPYLLFLIIRKKDITIFFSLSMFFSFYLQTLVSEDYIVRKYIVLYPVFVILVYIIVLEYVSNRNLIINFLKLFENKKRLFAYFYITLCTIVGGLIIYFRFRIISDGTIYDFSKDDILVISLLNIICLILIGIIGMNILKRNIIVLRCFIFTLFFSCSIHMYLDLKYVYTSRTYYEKECMVELGKIVGDDYVVGTFFPIGYTLYNDVKPIVTTTEKWVNCVERYPSVWSIDYNDTGIEGVRGYLDSIFEDSQYTLVEYKRLERNFLTFGKYRDVTLYKAERK